MLNAKDRFRNREKEKEEKRERERERKKDQQSNQEVNLILSVGLSGILVMKEEEQKKLGTIETIGMMLQNGKAIWDQNRANEGYRERENFALRLNF